MEKQIQGWEGLYSVDDEGNVYSEEQNIAIRNERKQGIAFQKIADKYEISKQNVMDICKGEMWKDLPGILNDEDVASIDNHAKGENTGSAKLTEARVRELRLDREQGITYVQLGNKYGISNVYL